MAPAVAGRPAAEPAWREVGGTLVGRVVAGSPRARFERLERASGGRIDWRFRQPDAALLWWRSGVGELRLTVDGTLFQDVVTGTSDLLYLPPHAEVTGTFLVESLCSYTVLFIEPALAHDHELITPHRPMVGFGHPAIVRGLRELAHETDHLDDTFDLFLDGGARQTLVHLLRLQRQPLGPPTAPTWLPVLEEHLRRHIADPVTVDQLAALTGFSTRQFLRAFRSGTGQTPMRWVLQRRLREAERRLTHTDDPITAIATTCGFNHAQHLSTAFRRAHGTSPSQFRRNPRAG